MNNYEIYFFIRLLIEKSLVMVTVSLLTLLHRNFYFIYVSNLMKFSTKRWFTIREILVIIVVISVGLLSVVVVLTNGMRYVQKTRQKVIALNLAREWMEAVYQMRDTNRTRRAWVKDQCRLKINPLMHDQWTERCADDLRFASGSYALQRLMAWEQQYFALSGPLSNWIDLSDGLDTNDYNFALCQQSGYRDSCFIGQTPAIQAMIMQNPTTEGKYFREIEWLWLYLKDVAVAWWSGIVCVWWASPDCWNNRAKEFRFCSKVSYVGDGTGEVKVCGVMTNFK